MTPAERLIARQRARLLKVERNGTSEIVRSYQAVLKDLNRHLAALSERINEARAAGIEVRPGWLAAERRYHALIAQHEDHTLNFLRQSLDTIMGTKGQAVTLAKADAPALATAAMGPAPTSAQAVVGNSFSQLPTSQIDYLVRRAADGRPLGELLAEIAPKATEKVKDAMLSGVARGAGVRDIARDVRKASGLAQNRALTIARQETIGAYRAVTSESYRRSPVVTDWTWYAQLDTRTCAICWAEHGTQHSDEETLDSHVCCRCSQMPRTKSWRDLGIDLPDNRPSIQPGPERFAALSEGDKLAILGRRRLDAYNRGEISLSDMVRDTEHRRWGTGKRKATLVELGVG